MEDAIVLGMSFWTLLSSLALPLVVGVVTKELASGALKSTVLLFLSVVNGVVSSAILNQGILTKETVIAAIISFVAATGAYYGYLKPSGTAPLVQEKTAGIGIGH